MIHVLAAQVKSIRIATAEACNARLNQDTESLMWLLYPDFHIHTHNIISIVMKVNLYLILPLMICSLLISCDKGERIDEKDSKDIYEEVFLRATDGYSLSNTWNLARLFSLDITPASDGSVKIYAPCKDEYRLVAQYNKASGSFTAYFDAPATAGNFIVRLGDALYLVNPGGSVSSHSVKATDVKVSDVPLKWILAVENIFDTEKKDIRPSSQIDLDFNDVLIGISSVVTDDYVSLDLEPLACGDDQPFYIHIYTEEGDRLLWQSNTELSDDCEFHQWFGVKDYAKGINTGVNAPGQSTGGNDVFTLEAFASTMSGCHIELPSHWTLSNYSHLSQDYKGNITDVWGLYITVGTYKGWNFVRDNSEYGLICSKGPGSAPQMLLFPDIGIDGQWRWPCEGNSLTGCYPSFIEWANDPDHELRVFWYEGIVNTSTTRLRY